MAVDNDGGIGNPGAALSLVIRANIPSRTKISNSLRFMISDPIRYETNGNRVEVLQEKGLFRGNSSALLLIHEWHGACNSKQQYQPLVT
jgi:hypothetical protein